MMIFKLSGLTLSNRFNNLESSGLVELYDPKGRFRKCNLNKSQKQQVKKGTKETPTNLKYVKKRIKQKWDILVSKDTLKKVLNLFKMSW